MKIILDARCVERKMHGIARYTLNLIRYLAEMHKESIFYVLHNSTVPPSLFGTSKNIETVCVDLKLYSLSEQFLLPRIIKRIRPDLYHSPTFSAPVIQHCPTILTIHDMIHLTGRPTTLSPFYQLYYRIIVKRAAMKAKRVITVSEFSRGEILRVLGIPPGKIDVTYNGIDGRFFLRKSTEHYHSLPDSGYWLFVGNDKPHKNVGTVLKAYFIAKDGNKPVPPLVLIGVSKKSISSFTPPEQLDGVIFLTIKSDDDLAAAYRRASIFIAPSLEEGFGFPVLEAMAAGTPVITSDIPVLKEITNGAAFHVDPLNAEAMSREILKLHGDDQLQKRLKGLGIKRAGLFTLKDTAERTFKIYNEALQDTFGGN